MKSEPPRITQFTAISGRNTPRVVYRAGAKRSTVISTICTAAAMVPMNRMNDRKLRFTVASAGLIHVRLPSPSR
jgi:hypothetical protein